MRRALLTPLVLLVTGTLLIASCAEASTDDISLTFEGDEGFQAEEDLDDEIDERIAPDTGLEGGEAPTSDQVVEAALLDVDAFWSRSYEDLYGEPYEPIEGGFWAYGPDSAQPPCGDPPPGYADIAQNAFYCPSADLIAWDNVNLVPGLYEEFGGFTLGIVFAHEFGHAIQTKSDTEGPTIILELQADCFAGAWTADVADGGSDYFELTLQDLDKAVAGFLELRDGVGTAAEDPAAHGTGFDRIGAFVDGFEQGAERCLAYPEEGASGELVVVEVPFTSEDDFQRGGNLPLDELGPLLLTDLENFWTLLFEEQGRTWTPVTDVVLLDPSVDEVECGGDTYSGDVLVNASFYCVDSDVIYLDGVNLVPTLNEIGDYAVATEIARQYAFAAQVRLGVLDNTVGTNLQADCLAGLYAFSGFAGNREGQGQELFLSPGDLDEAVIAFLLNSDASEDVEAGDVSVGTAFQRFDAYRAGFLQGTEACDALLEEG
ncbi:MAG: neutral zinc metallopeptidase [Acidimicrobiales bacterium]